MDSSSSKANTTDLSQELNVNLPPISEISESLLQRLQAARSRISAEEWVAALAATPRVPPEERALSWSFIEEWSRSLRDAGVDGEGLNSYQLVGDKDLSGEWQGSFGQDPSVCADWTVRSLAAATAQASLVETLQVAAKLTGDNRFIRDADGRPFFARATHFISYFWAAPFGRLRGALEAQRAKSEGGDSGAPSYFWIDIFCVGAYFPRVLARPCRERDEQLQRKRPSERPAVGVVQARFL